MSTGRWPYLSALLQAMSDELDIPAYAYEDAVLKYEDVGEWLSAEDSELLNSHPEIYVQGSFLLGTVVQPFGRDCEYDIDLVCKLEVRKESVTQAELKKRIGERLRKREDLANILSESRRCWLLDYPAQNGFPSFHMDVLPCIPNEATRPTGILLTDTDLTRWQASNPIAYAEWFKSRMAIDLVLQRAALASSLEVEIGEVPEWLVKTPLQRCVQLLKRHRDVHFAADPGNRPVSVIITTLAALSFDTEVDVFESLVAIADRMPTFIENRNGKWWVQNPVDDNENFADKWNEYPERREAFLRWLQKVSADCRGLARADRAEGVEILESSLGRHNVGKLASTVDAGVVVPARVEVDDGPAVPALRDSSHARSLDSEFPVAIQPACSIRVTAGVYRRTARGGKGTYVRPLLTRPVPKNVWLKFTAHVKAKEPYTVRWQVVNTGEEALGADAARGDFYESEGTRGVRWESTLYRGTHWVEGFVLDSAGVCVARSGKVYVKVR